MGLSSMVWERSEQRGIGSELSLREYIFAVSGFTMVGLIISAGIAFLTMPWQPNIWAALGVGLVIPIIGIFIAMGSDNWLVSLVGYLLVVSGLGAIIGPTVNLYQSAVVVNALVATAAVTVVMSIIGVAFPTLLLSWGGYLFGALTVLVFVRFGQLIAASFGVSNNLYDWPFIDYAAALLFTLYIIYDWNRAVQLPRTLNNAVDSAVAIYLDITNLFLNLLKIMGKGGRKN